MKWLWIGMVAAGVMLAQTESGSPAFEAAVVKPAGPLGPGQRYVPFGGGPGTKTPTRLTGMTTLKTLLLMAYRLKNYQLVGPEWLDTGLYDVAAKVPEGATKEQMAVMLQGLLREQFHLEIHRETKELPMYALLTAKGGVKLKPSETVENPEEALDAATAPRPKVTMGEDGFPQIPADAKMPGSFTLSLSSGEFLRTKLFGRRETMDELADFIGGNLNRAVKNLTELAGKYDFTLQFESDPRMPAALEADGTPRAPGGTGPTIFMAVQSQLGLRLEARKGPVELVVIDRVDKVPAGSQ